jgi:phosphate:Na+ symporter
MHYLIVFIFFILLFIFGMTLLRTGLFNLSADSLKKWIAKLTSSPWKGLLVGTLITALLQSSSAVMVLTIGLISARMLTFHQSIGIILGTNIGTTFTTEFITFQIDNMLFPLALTGGLLIWMKNKSLKSIGLILLGISLVFSAMKGFEFLVHPLTKIPIVETLLLSLSTSNLLSIITGVILTALIQSSTATTGIVMGFLAGGALNLGTGIAIMLGSNIGTCVTAYLASIGGGKEAKLSAYAHIWLNVVGVILFYPFIGQLEQLGYMTAGEPAVQLAHTSVLFNVLSSILVLPFASVFASFILKVHGRK